LHAPPRNGDPAILDRCHAAGTVKHLGDPLVVTTAREHRRRLADGGHRTDARNVRGDPGLVRHGHDQTVKVSKLQELGENVVEVSRRNVDRHQDRVLATSPELVR